MAAPAIPNFFNAPFEPGIEPAYNIFDYVQHKAAQYSSIDKNFLLTRKWKEIQNLEIPIWNKNTNPSALDFIYNVYYLQIEKIPYLSKYEKICFVYVAFDCSLRHRIFLEIMKAGEQIWNTNEISTKRTTKACSWRGRTLY